MQVASSIKEDDVSSFCSAKVSGSAITKTTTATNSSTIPSTADASDGSITDILGAMSLQAQVQRNIKNKDKLHVQLKSVGEAKSNNAADIISNEDNNSNLQHPPKYSRLNKMNDTLDVQNFKCSWPQPEKAKVDKWLASLDMIDLATFQQLQESPGNDYSQSFSVVVLLYVKRNYNPNERLYERMYKISCPFSSASSNTVTILQGCGNGSRLVSPIDTTICEYLL